MAIVKKMKKQNRRQKKSPRSNLPLAFRPMPNMHVNLVFKQEKIITESAASVGTANWYRINGAFDPDQSGVGPSALGFNNYATLFTNYRVHAMRIRVEGIVSAPASGVFLGAVTLTPNPRQITLPTDPALWGAEPGAVSKTLLTQAGGGKNHFILDKVYRPWEVMKITKQQYLIDADYASLVTTVPTLEAFVALTVNGIAATAALSLTALVTISYDVEFYNPVLLT